MSDAPPLSWIWGDKAQRKAFGRYWVRDVVQGLWAVGVQSLLGSFPAPVTSEMGASLALSAALLSRERDRQLRVRILKLRPDLEPRIDEVVRRAWANFGRVASEYCVLTKLWDGPLPEIEGREHMLAARSTGRPRIYVGLHLGMPEMLGPTLLRIGEDGMEAHQPQPNRFRRHFTEKLRKRYETQLLPPGAASAFAARRALQAGRGLVLFVDEIAFGRVQSPALGRPVSTRGNLGMAVRLAAMTSALILPAYVERIEGARFRVHILEAMEPLTDASGELRLKPTVTAIDRVLEQLALQHLDQWVMLHLLKLEP